MEKITEISDRVGAIIECCATTPHNFGKILGYSRTQTIYDILNAKCAPSYDFFHRFTHSEYSAIIELRWLLNGEGEMWTQFMRSLTHEEKITVVDDVNHGISVSNYQVQHEKAVQKQGSDNEVVLTLLQTIRDKDQIITQQAEEIRQQTARIAHLEAELQHAGNVVQSADSVHSAHVG